LAFRADNLQQISLRNYWAAFLKTWRRLESHSHGRALEEPKDITAKADIVSLKVGANK
jgi:hypothetical protein